MILKIFDHVINIENTDLDNALVDNRSQENTLIYDVAYKSTSGSKSLRSTFDKAGSCNKIFDRIRYFITLKSNISYVNFHKYSKTTINLADYLPFEKQ